MIEAVSSTNPQSAGEAAKRRDPGTRRELILMAALAEFGARGIAGSRVDRIAVRAGCSVGLIYANFGSKQGLFDSLFELIIERTQAEITTDGTDLADFAVRIHDGQQAYQDVIRLSMWHTLEAGLNERIEVSQRSAQQTVRAIAAAQESGAVTTTFTAQQLQTLTVALSSMWSTLPREVSDLVPDPAERRATILLAMRRILES